ncbi:integrase, catalytic region, zinc finger, CCHC-type containing protein [Tanacetum coccineum]|uniref:Integrase, catalytic region, zinc finger, CCHC-type containing protein n=1 Tax=Tanacetum coccineum TaxID=301880 RepID=A0ABQ5EVM1_9ASTR
MLAPRSAKALHEKALLKVQRIRKLPGSPILGDIVSGMVIAELRVEATTRLAAYMGSSSIGLVRSGSDNGSTSSELEARVCIQGELLENLENVAGREQKCGAHSNVRRTWLKSVQFIINAEEKCDVHSGKTGALRVFIGFIELDELIDAEAEAVHMILNRIRNDIYSTVDACPNANEMWISIECLQQGDSINIQDVKTKLQFVNQRTITVAGNRETIGNLVVQQSWIQCFNCKGFRHFAKECRKPKKDVLHTINDKSRATHDAEPLEKVQTDDDYNVLVTERQHYKQPESINNTYVVEMVDSYIILDSMDVCDNDRKDGQNAKEPEDECVLLASLIANLKLDVDENKKIQK